MKTLLLDWKIPLLASLTLGLAPFTEPHIWGKILWIKGGAVGMKTMDWFDTIMHGAPWIWLIIVLIYNLKMKFKK
jgi:hypothetical protein